MKISKKIAKTIELHDDETETGGTAFLGETLYDFMMELQIPFSTPLEEINKGLVECGIKPITNI